MRNKIYQTSLALSVCLLFTLNASAFRPFKAKRLEEARTPVFNLAPNATDATSAPFDGGISLLIAAGLGYAGKKSYDKRKKAKEQKLGK